MAAAASLCLCVCERGAEPPTPSAFAIQKTGTVAWEIAVIKARGLDKAADLDIETTELASTEAGKIALQGGAADMIVSDWLWVARERALGDKLLFTPYSTALGAVMAPRIRRSTRSPISPAARSASPADRSTRAGSCCRPRRAAQGSISRTSARPSYGAPPLIAEKLAQGRDSRRRSNSGISAPTSKRAASSRAIEMADVEKALGAEGPVAMTGYVVQRRLRGIARGRAAALFRRGRQGAQDARRTIRAPGRRSRRGCISPTMPTLDVYRQRYLRRRPDAAGRRGGGGRAQPVIGARRDRRQGARRRRRRSSTPACSTIPRRRMDRRDSAADLVLALIALWQIARAFRQSAACCRARWRCSQP